MTEKTFTESIEMYLKTLAEAGLGEPIAIGKIAEKLNITPVSANEMVQRLSRQGLVRHTPYKGVELTKKGRGVAVDVIRRQRLWECFLLEHLNLEWSQVYDFACSLEHATAPIVTEALAKFLGFPKTCPHGNAIPDENGNFEILDGIPLPAIEVGKNVIVQSIKHPPGDVLAYLQERNIMPGQQLQIAEVAPMEGPLTLEINGREVALGLNIAEFVNVTLCEE